MPPTIALSMLDPSRTIVSPLAALGMALFTICSFPLAAAQLPEATINAAAYAEPAINVDDDNERSQEQAKQLEMVRQLARHRGGHPAALAQVIQMTRAFPEADAAALFDELAQAHLREGNLNLAAETRRALAERFPAQPRGHDAILWLVRLYASSEVAHARREISAGAAVIQRQLPGSFMAAREQAPATVKNSRGEGAAAAPPGDPLSIYALHLATQAMASHAELADEPALAFERSVAARRAGQLASAQAFLSPLKHRRAGDPWGDCARAEAWLQLPDRDTLSPKPTLRCLVAATPPQLDGLLDEPYWQQTAALPPSASGAPSAAPIDSAASSPPAPSPESQIQWAYDQKYLYLAVKCAKAPGLAYPPDNRPRPRDGAVEAYDRVRLCLDVDRDYASFFELVVDSRGWTADRCWGDPAWNPGWFVAASPHNAESSAWIVEIAIPWNELTAAPPRSGDAWSCAIDRLIPHPTSAANQSRPAPASAAIPPENFSLLLFE